MTDETDGTNEAEPTVPDSLVIDLTEVRDAEGLQRLLQRELRFPDFYGRNWNAFWDAVTGLVDLPHELTFTGWDAFSASLPAKPADCVNSSTTTSANTAGTSLCLAASVTSSADSSLRSGCRTGPSPAAELNRPGPTPSPSTGGS